MNRFLCIAAFAVAALVAPQASLAGYVEYDAVLSGLNEPPANTSPGTGFAQIFIDAIGNKMEVKVSFSGLLGTTAAAHIHAGTPTPGTGSAGVATTTPYFSGFPIGVTSGTYDNVLDMTMASSYNPSYVTAHGGTTATAEAALFSSIAAGTSYFNIHTSVYPAGEIEGFLVPSVVPEPSSMVLCGLGGAIALGLARIRRRHRSA